MAEKIRNKAQEILLALVLMVCVSIGAVAGVIISGHDAQDLITFIMSAVIPTTAGLVTVLKVDGGKGGSEDAE